MTAQHDLDRTLGAWFGTEAAPAPPPEPLARILESTRQRRPRPWLIAGIGSHWADRSTGRSIGDAALRPGLILALVALLALALVGAAVLVGSPRTAQPQLPFTGTYRGEFITLPDLPRPMAYPQVVPLVDGRVLVIGNGGDGGDPTVTGELYDPLTGTTDRLGPISTPRGFIDQAVRLDDGRVLILADGTAEVFDPATRIVTGAGPMVHPSRAPAVALHDGRVLIAGGITPGGGIKTGLLSGELFDPDSLTFSATGSMDTTAGSLVLLPDGRVFVAPDDPQNVAQLYDPTTGTFAAAGRMATPFGVSSADQSPRRPDHRLRERRGTRGPPAARRDLGSDLSDVLDSGRPAGSGPERDAARRWPDPPHRRSRSGTRAGLVGDLRSGDGRDEPQRGAQGLVADRGPTPRRTSPARRWPRRREHAA